MAFQTFNQGAVQSAYIGYKKYIQDQFDPQGDLQLYWANAGQLIPTNQLMAQFMDIEPTSLSTVSIPSAKEVGLGTNFIIYNSGSANLIATDRTDPENITPIVIIPPGQTIYFILQIYEAELPDLRWKVFNFASTTGLPIVADLAGYGLAPQIPQNKLMTNIFVEGINDPVGTEIFSTDRAKFFVSTSGSSTFVLTGDTLIDGWYCSLLNLGSGQITISVPSGSLIDGATNKTISLKQSLTICCDGVNYYSLGYGQQTSNITIPLTITNGGTGASSQAQALLNLMPPAPSTGNIVYYNGTNWVVLANPSSDIRTLKNDPSGNIDWTLTPEMPFAASNGDVMISDATLNWTTISPASAGNIMFWNGTNWVMLAAPGVGSMMYWNGANWVNLNIGTPGQVLKVSGGGLPEWSAP